MSKRKNRSVSNQVTELLATSDRMTPERRAHLEKFVADRFPADVVQLIEELTPLPAEPSPTLVQLNDDLRQAIRAGFTLAIARYLPELKGNVEAMAIISARKVGVKKGHETQTEQREARYQRIRDKWAAMESAGARVTNETVAAAVREDGEKRCSARTVQRAFAAAEQQSRPTKRAKR
jgi:hypothetical protein